jgi:hypothetical protein
MRLCHVIHGVVACAAAIGCGGGPDPGEARRVVLFCPPAETETAATAVIQITVDVEDAAGDPVEDALVTIGGAVVAPDAVSPGTYRDQRLGCAASHAIEIATTDRTTTGTVTMPSVHAATLSPDVPIRDQAATASWTPSGEDVRVLVNVQDSSTSFSYLSEVEPDDGSASIPGSAFPLAQTYVITVQRERLTELDDVTSADAIIARFLQRDVQ